MKWTLRWLTIVVLLVVSGRAMLAESVATIAAPTGYVNDYAGVLSPEAKQSLEELCIEVDRKAHAQIAVVTVLKLEANPEKGADLPAPSIEEFAVKLEEKWKVGAKGTDRGVLVIVSLNPRKYRIEVGYGLEGILPDGKVGDIGREMQPFLRTGDYSQALTLGVREIAQDIATDAGVTLSAAGASGEQAVPHYYREVPAQPQISPIGALIFAVILIVVIGTLIRTGHIGLLFFLLFNLLGSGGRGNDDDRGGGFGGGFGGGDGGGFGGFGGGGSGGGGASGDF
jgi:uncharacterized protein